jgi:hypothetical protein
VFAILSPLAARCSSRRRRWRANGKKRWTKFTAALAYAEECGNCFWNAHLLKLQGDFLQALSASGAQVETCYQRAITVARNQRARSFELRATTSLARL